MIQRHRTSVVFLMNGIGLMYGIDPEECKILSATYNGTKIESPSIDKCLQYTLGNLPPTGKHRVKMRITVEYEAL